MKRHRKCLHSHKVKLWEIQLSTLIDNLSEMSKTPKNNCSEFLTSASIILRKEKSPITSYNLL